MTDYIGEKPPAIAAKIDFVQHEINRKATELGIQCDPLIAFCIACGVIATYYVRGLTRVGVL